MAKAQIIDGKAMAAGLRAALARRRRGLPRAAWRGARACGWCWSATIRPAAPMCAARTAWRPRSASIAR